MPKLKRTKTTQIRQTVDEKQCLREVSRREGEGASHILRRAFREYIERHHPDLLVKR